MKEKLKMLKFWWTTNNTSLIMLQIWNEFATNFKFGKWMKTCKWNRTRLRNKLRKRETNNRWKWTYKCVPGRKLSVKFTSWIFKFFHGFFLNSIFFQIHLNVYSKLELTIKLKEINYSYSENLKLIEFTRNVNENTFELQH